MEHFEFPHQRICESAAHSPPGNVWGHMKERRSAGHKQPFLFACQKVCATSIDTLSQTAGA